MGLKIRRALEVGRVARRGRLLRVLGEVGVVGKQAGDARGRQGVPARLEELGTTYVKLGQLLSSRPDLLPDVYIEELGELVDDVPPFPFARGAQDHRRGHRPRCLRPARRGSRSRALRSRRSTARLLRTGREVVVKVRRPGIEEQVALDLELLRSLTSFAEGHSETARLVQMQALAEELEAHLSAELDFVEEAHGSELIAKLAAEHEHLVVPDVIHPYVTERVLVQERIDGREGDGSGTASTPSARKSSPGSSSAPTCSRSRCTASTTPIRTAATSCSRPTGGSACSTSACSDGSTTTRGGRSACSCSRSRRTAPTTSPT